MEKAVEWGWDNDGLLLDSQSGKSIIRADDISPADAVEASVPVLRQTQSGNPTASSLGLTTYGPTITIGASQPVSVPHYSFYSNLDTYSDRINLQPLKSTRSFTYALASTAAVPESSASVLGPPPCLGRTTSSLPYLSRTTYGKFSCLLDMS